MELPLAKVLRLFQASLVPPSLDGDGLMLHPSHFTNTNKSADATRTILITEKIKKYLLLDKDVLIIAKGREHNAFLYSRHELPTIPSSAFIVMRMADEAILLPEYLVWFLNHNVTQGRLATIAKGTAMTAISISELAAFNVQVPKISFQKNIAQIVKLQNCKESLESELKILTQRKIQSQLFKLTKI